MDTQGLENKEGSVILFTIGEHFESEFMDLINKIPKELKKLNGIEELDPFKLADEYYAINSVADVSIDPNANINGKSPVNFQSEIFKPLLKMRSLYVMWKEVAESEGMEKANESISSCLTSKLYFHDLTKIDVPYCFASDTTNWLLEGRPYGWLPGSKPKKLQSFIGQTVEVTMDMSQEHAGAVALPNILVNCAYYAHYDRVQLKRSVNHLDRLIPLDAPNRTEEIINIIVGFFAHNDEDFFKKRDAIFNNFDPTSPSFFIDGAMYLYDKIVADLLQHLVHVLHNTFRVGGDAPFTNLSLFCRETIKSVFAEALYPDWTSPVDMIDEIMHMQELFARFFAEGSPITGKNYRFPVSTVNFATKTREVPEGEVFDPERHFTEEAKQMYPDKKYLVKDREFLKLITKYNAKRGVFNFHRGEKLASCCRLTSSLADLREKFRADSFGNGGLSLGSMRVVALNLHGIACEAKYSDKSFAELIDHYQEQAEILLIAHREWIKKIIKTGTLKFFNIGWERMEMFFSTFGFTGLWDAYNVLYANSGDEDVSISYEQFAKTVINRLEQNANQATKRRPDCAFNVEEIPGENASPKMAKMDNFIYASYEDYQPVPLLSNQLLPLYEDYDMFERIRIMGDLMDNVSGGTICHFNVDGSMTNESSYELTKMMLEDYGLIHFAVEIGSSTCVNGHTSVGVHLECPVCKGVISTWTRRIVGYSSDTKDWIAVRRDWENLRRLRYSMEDFADEIHKN